MDLFASATATLLTLRDGQRILINPATPDDTAPLSDLLLRLTPQTLRLRQPQRGASPPRPSGRKPSA
ncbi:MAG: hypothetical protein U0841_11210 [Chloroflexia bacterium]